MFEYEWGNPSSVLFRPPTADPVDDGHHHRDSAEGAYSHVDAIDIPSFAPPAFLPLHHHSNNHFHSFPTATDPRGFPSASYPPAPSSDDFDSPAALFALPKAGPDPPGYGSSAASLDRIGLNLGLGGRTYFSAADEGGFLSRLYRGSRPFVDGGIGGSLAANSPRCQVEGCNADLSNAKHYHRRHKVCEFHSKSSTVVAGGLTQRFCQQCSRFHLLTEFDNGKRSCRRRLADHNRRRRKSHRTDNVGNSPACSENTPRSPSESRAHSSVTAAAVEESKPPSCYNSSEVSPSVSSNSLFY